MQQPADVHHLASDVQIIQSDVQTIIHSMAAKLGIETHLVFGAWWASPYIRNQPLPEQNISVRNPYSKLRN